MKVSPNSPTKTLVLGILFLFVCLNFYIFGGYLHYRLHEKHGTWYNKVTSSLTPSALKCLLKPQVAATLTISTFTLTIVLWILQFIDDNANFMAPVLFNAVTLSTYFVWLPVFYVKKNLIWVSVIGLYTF